MVFMGQVAFDEFVTSVVTLTVHLAEVGEVLLRSSRVHVGGGTASTESEHVLEVVGPRTP